MPADRKRRLVLALAGGAATGALATATKPTYGGGAKMACLAFGALVIAGGAIAMRPRESLPSAAPATSLVATPASASAPVRSDPKSPPSISVDALPPAAVTTAAPRRPMAPGPTSALADEVRWLDRARHAIAAGDNAAASDALRGYRSAHPTGVLSTEADVLEVDLLVRRGEREAARARAQTFVATHPNSPHAARLRRWLETAETTR